MWDYIRRGFQYIFSSPFVLANQLYENITTGSYDKKNIELFNQLKKISYYEVLLDTTIIKLDPSQKSLFYYTDLLYKQEHYLENLKKNKDEIFDKLNEISFQEYKKELLQRYSNEIDKINSNEIPFIKTQISELSTEQNKKEFTLQQEIIILQEEKAKHAEMTMREFDVQKREHETKIKELINNLTKYQNESQIKDQLIRELREKNDELKRCVKEGEEQKNVDLEQINKKNQELTAELKISSTQITFLREEQKRNITSISVKDSEIINLKAQVGISSNNENAEKKRAEVLARELQAKINKQYNEIDSYLKTITNQDLQLNSLKTEKQQLIEMMGGLLSKNKVHLYIEITNHFDKLLNIFTEQYREISKRTILIGEQFEQEQVLEKQLFSNRNKISAAQDLFVSHEREKTRINQEHVMALDHHKRLFNNELMGNQAKKVREDLEDDLRAKMNIWYREFEKLEEDLANELREQKIIGDSLYNIRETIQSTLEEINQKQKHLEEELITVKTIFDNFKKSDNNVATEIVNSTVLSKEHYSQKGQKLLRQSIDEYTSNVVRQRAMNANPHLQAEWSYSPLQMNKKEKEFLSIVTKPSVTISGAHLSNQVGRSSSGFMKNTAMTGEEVD